jgi:hypothetical protein
MLVGGLADKQESMPVTDSALICLQPQRGTSVGIP